MLLHEIRYQFLPDSDVKKEQNAEQKILAICAGARSELDSEAAAFASIEAHPTPKNEFNEYPTPGKYVQQAGQYVDSSFSTGETDADFDITQAAGLKYATPSWKPAVVEKARQAIESRRQSAQKMLAIVNGELQETPLQRLAITSWAHALSFFDEFLYFFLINLLAYGVALLIEKSKRMGQKRLETAK